MRATIDLSFLDDPPRVRHHDAPAPDLPDSPVVWVVVASNEPEAVGGTWHADGTFRYPTRPGHTTDL